MNVNDLDAHKIVIFSIVRCSMKAARQKYNAFSAEQKKNKDIQKSQKQKLIEGEATELKRKKKLLGNTLIELNEKLISICIKQKLGKTQNL